MMASPENSRPKRVPVLGDHHRDRKRFIPPFVHAIPLSEVSWLRTLLPEMIWIGLLHEEYGLQEGAKLALSVAVTMDEVRDSVPQPLFSLASEYGILSAEEWEAGKQRLKEGSELERIATAIAPLLVHYPQFPMRSLAEDELGTLNSYAELDVFAERLGGLFDRSQRSAMLVQGTAVYIAGVTQKIHFSESAPPPDLESLTNYPDTESSRMNGSKVRAIVNGFLPMTVTGELPWPVEFWNRGIQLTECRN